MLGHPTPRDVLWAFIGPAVKIVAAAAVAVLVLRFLWGLV